MVNYEYYIPTRLVFGKGQELRVAELIRFYGGTKVLLHHYGDDFINKSSLLAQIKKTLDDAGLPWLELGGVLPNPRLSLARKGAKLCREQGVDFILAIGGGSVIDSAKAIAAQSKMDTDFWSCFMDGSPIEDAIAIGAVLTISAAGSEGGGGLVITNEEVGMKRPYNSPHLFPKFAILNPELQYTLPKFQTACGCYDILSHLMERYFTPETHTEATDRMIEGCAIAILNNAGIVMRDPYNYNARAEITQIGTLAHNGLLDCGRTADWAAHSMEHELSAFNDVVHAAGLSILTPAWMKYVYKANVNRFVQFAVRVFRVDMSYDSLDEIAEEMIRRIEEWAHFLGLPTRLSEINFKESDIQTVADMCFVGMGATIGNFRPLTREDVVNILKSAM